MGQCTPPDGPLDLTMKARTPWEHTTAAAFNHAEYRLRQLEERIEQLERNQKDPNDRPTPR